MSTDPRIHHDTWALLPWLANGSASAEQRRRAESHLGECNACRDELAREQRLAAGMAVPSVPGPDLSQGLARLMQRLDHAVAPRPARPWFTTGSVRGAQIRLSTAAALGGLQLALFVAAAAWWLQASAPSGAAGVYQTLTQAPAAAAAATPALRVVFEAERPVSEVQALLLDRGLAIVSGPSEAGVFTLGVAETDPQAGQARQERDLDALAADLRRSPAVAFAEATGPAVAR